MRKKSSINFASIKSTVITDPFYRFLVTTWDLNSNTIFDLKLFFDIANTIYRCNFTDKTTYEFGQLLETRERV